MGVDQVHLTIDPVPIDANFESGLLATMWERAAPDPAFSILVQLVESISTGPSPATVDANAGTSWSSTNGRLRTLVK